MSDELIDIYDENNVPLGMQELKSVAHRDGLWHRVAHVWIYNSKGEVLLQLRAKNKNLYPSRWDISAAGHFAAGEEPISAALREVKEEIGLTVDKSDLVFYKIMKGVTRWEKIINNEFYYIYLLRFDGNIADLKIQKEELGDIRFVTPEELQEDLTKNPQNYVAHGDYWLEMLRKIKMKIV